ncbi:MAG: hypothetical protein VW397_03000 [Candidatus Margulisiibacteriota bacterium]
MAYLLAAIIITLCFSGIGIGILLFGRKDISSECGNVPNHDTNECASKAAGICPTASPNNEALDMALTFTKFHKIKKKNSLNSEDSDQNY